MACYLRTALLLSALSLASVNVFAQGDNPFIGTWDINLLDSNFGSATPPANMSRTYFDHGDGTYTYMVITTGTNGALSGSTAQYSYSGERYSIASFNQDQHALISYRRINDTTVEYTVYVDGEVQQIGAKFISPNYQQLTIAIQFPNSEQENQVLIFNRRS